MMGNTAALLDWELRRANVKVAIYLQRVAIDDLAPEPCGDFQRQFALAGPGRTGDCNQWPVEYVYLDGVMGI